MASADKQSDARFDALRRLDPEFAAVFDELADAPGRIGALEPRVVDFAMLAAYAASTHLQVDGIRSAIRSAIAHGAETGEILEVLEVASVLGIHTLTVGVPVLVESAADAGLPVDAGALTPEQESLKAEFVEKRGYWTELWQQVLTLSPAYFTAYLHFSSLPWTRNVLDAKTKELVYIAIAASTTHLFEPGIRVHIANAFQHGASVAEVMELLQVVSLLGIDTMIVALPILEEELRRADS